MAAVIHSTRCPGIRIRSGCFASTVSFQPLSLSNSQTIVFNNSLKSLFTSDSLASLSCKTTFSSCQRLTPLERDTCESFRVWDFIGGDNSGRRLEKSWEMKTFQKHSVFWRDRHFTPGSVHVLWGRDNSLFKISTTGFRRWMTQKNTERCKVRKK